MDAMIGGADDQILKGPDIDLHVGVFPELNQEPDGITNARFERA
jgi:hypothetical protein